MRNRSVYPVVLISLLIVTTLFNILISAKSPIRVFVSILPQKYFVERIGGEQVTVSVMVGPGKSPATYEPLPKQMAALSGAALYFRIGVPFENIWMDRVQAANTKMRIIDTREGIALRAIEAHHHHDEDERHEENGHEEHKEAKGERREEHEEEAKNEGHGEKDPHIWLNPELVKIQAATICKGLVAVDPQNKVFYEKNLQSFLADLDALDKEIAAALKNLPVKKIMVFHPSWGYFADRYGLKQIPIEIEGKEPGPKELAEIIEHAKAEQIKVIFVQTQFSTKTAESVAKAIQGKVITIDPLAENYLENLRRIVKVLTGELK